MSLKRPRVPLNRTDLAQFGKESNGADENWSDLLTL